MFGTEQRVLENDEPARLADAVRHQLLQRASGSA
jgi:hypothetical protein